MTFFDTDFTALNSTRLSMRDLSALWAVEGHTGPRLTRSGASSRPVAPGPFTRSAGQRGDKSPATNCIGGEA